MHSERDAPRLSSAAITAMMIAAAQTPLSTTMIAVALPEISATLAVDLALVTSLLVTTYMMITIVGQNPGGKLADVLGRWRTLELGMVICGLGALLGTIVPAFWPLVIARCLIALGGALMGPAVLALLRAHVPEARRGRMFAVYTATLGLAAAVGPPIGGELVHVFGWRAIFAINLPLLVLAWILVRASRHRPETSAQKRRLRDVAAAFDWLGTALLAGTLAALGLARAWAFALCVVGAGAFIAWERRAADPILRPGFFANRVFAAGCLVIFLQSLAMYGVMFQLPQFFEVVRGATSRDTGLLLLIMMVGLLFASAVGGTLSDRFGPRTTALAGVTLMIAGMFWLTRLASFAVPADAYGPALLLGAALGVTWAPAQSSTLAAVDAAQSGIASGTTTTCRYLGGAIGAMILAAYVGRSTSDPVAAHVSVSWLFTAAVVLSSIGCLGLPGKDVEKSACAQARTPAP